jgi:hypothetical protein
MNWWYGSWTMVEWDMIEHIQVCLRASPGCSLISNVVVPLAAVDPDDGRILLSTGSRIGFYDPESA